MQFITIFADLEQVIITNTDKVKPEDKPDLLENIRETLAEYRAGKISEDEAAKRLSTPINERTKRAHDKE